jgi:FixJ family two-component response regulator
VHGDLIPAFLVRKQYQRLIDGPYRVVHCFVMKAHPGNGASERPLLSVVDDYEMLRESLPDLLREFGFTARAFSSGQEFLSSDYVGETRCLILDVAMPGMSGLDLQNELKRREKAIPIIFMSGQRDEKIRKQALRQGAVKFLYKPFSDSALLDAINAGLDAD